MIYKEDLEELFKNAPAGGTAVLFVEDDSVMRVDDLKAVIATYSHTYQRYSWYKSFRSSFFQSHTSKYLRYY